MPFEQFDQVEPILLSLRQSGCIVRDVEIGKPELEDVFIRVMQAGNEASQAV